MTTYTVAALGREITIYAPRPGEFDRAAYDADTHLARTEGLLGLDVESTATGARGHADPDWRLRLIQFGTATSAWVLDPSDPAQYEAAHETLAHPDQWFVSHTNYDVLAVWYAFGVALGQRVADTHLLSKILDPDELAGHGLKELTRDHFDEVLSEHEDRLHAWFNGNAPKGVNGKNKRAAWGWNNVPSDLPEYVVYAGLDAVYARALLPVLLTACQPVTHIVTMEHWLAAQATGVMLRGIPTDTEYVRDLLASTEREYRASDEAVMAALGFSARSPRFAAWVAEQSPLPDLPRTPTGRLRLTTQIDGVTQLIPALLLAAKEWPPAARELLEHKATITRTANLLSNLRQFVADADEDGRVHPSLNTLRARTARMSVTKPALQTLKKSDSRLRACFTAEPGHVLVACDFSQVEVRVAAALSRDARLTQVIADGEDVHNVTAAALFGPDYTKAQRNVGKRATFGTIYGGGAVGLATQTGVPVSEAAGIVKRWSDTYPGIKRYAKRVGRLNTVITASGRRIPADPRRRYANINYAVQSTARDLLVEALYILLAREGLAPYLWMLVHDEIIVSVPAEDAERVHNIMAKAMTGCFWGVPIDAEAEILGVPWGLLDGRYRVTLTDGEFAEVTVRGGEIKPCPDALKPRLGHWKLTAVRLPDNAHDTYALPIAA